jgi:putative tricarboxylic transport membrane protein
MKSLDRMSGLVLLGFGILILVKSIEFPFGTLQMPGAAVFPILASSLLMVISGTIVISSFLKPRRDQTISLSTPQLQKPLRRVVVGVGALLAYRYLLAYIGFPFACFLFILFLAKALGQYSWKTSLLFSLGTAVVCYYLFQILLKIPMPGGILGI